MWGVNPTARPSVENAVVESELEIAPAGRNAIAIELFRRRDAELIGLARTLVDTRDEAEEVVQEAFGPLVAAFGRLDPARADGYVTVNVARGRLRRRRTARAAALPPRQQACVVLRFCDWPDEERTRARGLRRFGQTLLWRARIALAAGLEAAHGTG